MRSSTKEAERGQPRLDYPLMWPPFQELRRSAIRTRAENGATLPVISPVRIDLSLMIFDKTAECCDALRQIFTSKVSIVVFRPFPVLSELLVDFHVCIALPASIADSLAAGQPTAMPFPLGQLNHFVCGSCIAQDVSLASTELLQ